MPQKTLSLDDLPVRPGDLIAGKYRIEGILGKGGMGVIATAMHEALKERVAIKFLLIGEDNKAELGRRFLREARLAVKIKSDHVVRIIDLGKLEDGMPYMVMEYLVGRDLSAVIRERGPLPIGEAAEYIVQICAGAAAAHALGIVHRDIKPANLFLTTGPTGEALVKILDFGISKDMSPEDSDLQTQLTGPCMVMGSLKYMSPEQIRSSSDVDARSDVWSIGVILYQLLTGKQPFVSTEPVGVVAAICSDPPVPLREERPDAPPELESILLRCLEKNIARRIPSALELSDALEPFRVPGAVPMPLVMVKDAFGMRSSIFSLSSISITRPPLPPGSAGAAGDTSKGLSREITVAEGAIIRRGNDPRPSKGEIALLRRFPATVAIAVAGAALAAGAVAFVGVRSLASMPAPPATTTPVSGGGSATAPTGSALAAATTTATVDAPSPSAFKPAPPADKDRPGTGALIGPRERSNAQPKGGIEIDSRY